MQAYILINTEAGKAIEVLDSIKKIMYVKKADAIIGPYDIIALIESADPSGLTSLIVDDIQKIEGVSRTLTCIAAS
jgi:DNA-binding Lrp family transcriptional regulator